MESHTQLPDTQWRPTAHIALVPQRHVPPVLQVFARMGSHVVHCAPLVPHWLAVVGVTHVEPLQHPLAQLVESQPVQV